ncbi:MAG: hypothetical protein M3N38_09515, partial [Pseudomonadota bacterium]|nr:hypothetical protein [Pseudomonadota bacterium]
MGRALTVAINLFVVVLTSPVLSGEARAESPPKETMDVPSLTLTDEQFLRGETENGVRVTLTGELLFPN